MKEMKINVETLQEVMKLLEGYRISIVIDPKEFDTIPLLE
jgi:hypothetical protein